MYFTEVGKPEGDSECSKQEENDATDNNTSQKVVIANLGKPVLHRRIFFIKLMRD